jgi:hypothetical protein
MCSIANEHQAVTYDSLEGIAYGNASHNEFDGLPVGKLVRYELVEVIDRALRV